MTKRQGGGDYRGGSSIDLATPKTPKDDRAFVDALSDAPSPGRAAASHRSKGKRAKIAKTKAQRLALAKANRTAR